MRRVYDQNDNVTEQTDGLGNRTVQEYDTLNRLIATTDPRGERTTFRYDAVSNLVGFTDPADNDTTFVYDALYRRTEEMDPHGQSLLYGYDAASRLTSITDRLDRRREFSYDAASQLLTETWKDSGGSTVNTLSFSYDAEGNLLTAGDDDGTFEFTYDALNRPTQVNGLFGLNLTAEYDAVGNRTRLEDSFGGVITSEYNEVNRLEWRKFDGSGQTLRFDFAYTDRHEVQTLTRYSDLDGMNQVGESSFEYDGAGRLTDLVHKDGSGTPLLDLGYAYDDAGRLETQTRDGTTTTFTYDAASQLTGDGSQSYSYDGAGNREMDGYDTDPGNRLQTDGTWDYTYDDEGNTTKKVHQQSGVTWTYEYDHRNQLTSAERRSSDGGPLEVRLEYKYDVFARRIEESRWTDATGTQVTRFGYDGPDVLVDLDVNNAVTVRYVRPDGIDALGARISSGGAVTWYLTDRQGSVVALTDASGAVQDQVVYDGFGRVVSESNPGFGDRYQYTGREYQADLGWQFNRGRWYDPTTGRWASEDPIRERAGDPNYYRYVGNGPTNATDPSGLEEEEVPRLLTRGEALRPRSAVLWDSRPNSAREAFDAFLSPRGSFSPWARNAPWRQQPPKNALEAVAQNAFEQVSDAFISVVFTHEFQQGLRAIGGLLEAASGVILLVTPDPSGVTKAAGLVLIGHGLDTTVAAGRSLDEGSNVKTMTHQLVAAGVRATGGSPEAADSIAVIFDNGVPFVAGLGASGAQLFNAVRGAGATGASGGLRAAGATGAGGKGDDLIGLLRESPVLQPNQVKLGGGLPASKVKGVIVADAKSLKASVTAPTGGAGASKDVALGMTHHGTPPPKRMMQAGIPPNTITWEREAIEVFGKNRNAASYRHWMREGLTQADPRFELQRAFNEATTNAKNIHFNLDGFDLKRAWRSGQTPGPYDLADNVTNWEFVQILKDVNLRGKTTFWQNGQQVPLSRVLDRAGATLPP